MLLDIAGPIKLIKAQDRVSFPYCHCLYVDDDTKAVFDTGAGKKSFGTINTERVARVFYTHFHPDHTHGHELFHQASHAIHALDYPAMVWQDEYRYYSGQHLWDELIGTPGPDYNRMVQAKRADPGFPEMDFRPKRIDLMLQDGDVIDFGRTRATVVHTPGHTPGHCCFFFEHEGLLFAGDIDLIEFGPWYGDYLSNVDDFINSIEKVKTLQPRILVSCHRRVIVENISRELDIYLDKLVKREERIIKALGEPATVSDLAERHIIYERHWEPFTVFWEKMMLIKHLERLERQGRVQQEGDYWLLT